MKNLLLIVFLTIGMAGCSESENPMVLDYTEQSITEFNELGWLGAWGHGAQKTVKIPSENGFDYPGGFVIRGMEDASVLAAAGLRTGDVIYQVSGDLLPNKEDPSIDLFKRIEASVTAGKTQISLTCLRASKSLVFTLMADPKENPPINPGRHEPCPRYRAAAKKAVDFLKSVQKEDGAFDTAKDNINARLAMASMAGLAFMADGRHEGAQKKCLDYVKKAVKDKGANHLGLAHGVILLAEQSRREMKSFTLSEGVKSLKEVKGQTIQLSEGDFKDLGAISFSQGSDNFQSLVLMGDLVKRICDAQEEDGGWPLDQDPKKVGICEKTLASSLCVFALGCAERSGVFIKKPEVFKNAFAYLKKHTNNGDVSYAPGPVLIKGAKPAGWPISWRP